MSKKNKMTFQKRRREMDKKKARAEKLDRKHNRDPDAERPDIPDPLAIFKEYEEEHGTGLERPEGHDDD